MHITKQIVVEGDFNNKYYHFINKVFEENYTNYTFTSVKNCEFDENLMILIDEKMYSLFNLKLDISKIEIFHNIDKIKSCLPEFLENSENDISKFSVSLLKLFLSNRNKNLLFHQISVSLRNLENTDDSTKVILFGILICFNRKIFENKKKIEKVFKKTKIDLSYFNKGEIFYTNEFFLANSIKENISHSNEILLVISLNANGDEFSNTYVDVSSFNLKLNFDILICPFTKFLIERVEQKTVYLRELPYHSFIINLKSIFPYDESKEIMKKIIEIKAQSIENLIRIIGGKNAFVRASLKEFSKICYSLGNYKESKENYEKLLSIHQSMKTVDDIEVADIYNDLALLENKLWNNKEALEKINSSLAIKLKLFGECHLSTAIAYNNRGLIYYSNKSNEEALKDFNTSYDIREKIHNEDTDANKKPSLPIAISLNNIGLIKLSTNNFLEAKSCFERSLKIKLHLFDNRDPALMVSYNNLGVAHKSLNEFEKAIEYYSKSLDLLQSKGGNQSDVATALNNMGLLYLVEDNNKMALEYLTKSLEIRKEIWVDQNHPDFVTSYNNLGSYYEKISSFDEALKYYKLAKEIGSKIYKEKYHPEKANSYFMLTGVYQKKDNQQLSYHNFKYGCIQAEKCLKNVKSLDLANLHSLRGNYYFMEGNYKTAMESYKQSIDIKIDLRDKTLEIACSYLEIGNVCFKEGKYQLAIENYSQALKNMEDLLGENHFELVDVLNNIGITYENSNNLEMALKFYERIKTIRRKYLPVQTLQYASCLCNLGSIMNSLKQYKTSLENYQEAFEIKKEKLGEFNMNVLVLGKTLNQVKKNLDELIKK